MVILFLSIIFSTLFHVNSQNVIASNKLSHREWNNNAVQYSYQIHNNKHWEKPQVIPIVYSNSISHITGFGNNSNKRIAFVENTFTYAAYRNGSFYNFYKKYIPITEKPSTEHAITTDLNLLTNKPIPHGPFPYYAHPRQPPDIPYIEYFKLLLQHVKKK